MHKRVVLIGAGAHARVTMDILENTKIEVAGFLDDNKSLKGKEINNKKILGEVSDAVKMVKDCKFIITMGNNHLRKIISEKLGFKETVYENAVHPSSVILKSASIGYGNMIFANSFIGSNAKIRNHVIVNNGAIIEHDCIIDNFVHIGSGCCMGGRVSIMEGVFLSVGITLKPRVTIGAKSIIGAGSVVVSDIPEGVLAYGVPAKVIRKVASDEMWDRLL